MNYDPKNKIDLYLQIRRDPRVKKILKEAWDAPIGSSKIKEAKLILNSLEKYHTKRLSDSNPNFNIQEIQTTWENNKTNKVNDGKGGPMDSTNSTAAPTQISAGPRMVATPGLTDILENKSTNINATPTNISDLTLKWNNNINKATSSTSSPLAGASNALKSFGSSIINGVKTITQGLTQTPISSGLNTISGASNAPKETKPASLVGKVEPGITLNNGMVSTDKSLNLSPSELQYLQKQGITEKDLVRSNVNPTIGINPSSKFASLLTTYRQQQSPQNQNIPNTGISNITPQNTQNVTGTTPTPTTIQPTDTKTIDTNLNKAQAGDIIGQTADGRNIYAVYDGSKMVAYSFTPPSDTSLGNAIESYFNSLPPEQRALKGYALSMADQGAGDKEISDYYGSTNGLLKLMFPNSSEEELNAMSGNYLYDNLGNRVLSLKNQDQSNKDIELLNEYKNNWGSNGEKFKTTLNQFVRNRDQYLAGIDTEKMKAIDQMHNSNDASMIGAYKDYLGMLDTLKARQNTRYADWINQSYNDYYDRYNQINDDYNKISNSAKNIIADAGARKQDKLAALESMTNSVRNLETTTLQKQILYDNAFKKSENLVDPLTPTEQTAAKKSAYEKLGITPDILTQSDPTKIASMKDWTGSLTDAFNTIANTTGITDPVTTMQGMVHDIFNTYATRRPSDLLDEGTIKNIMTSVQQFNTLANNAQSDNEKTAYQNISKYINQQYSSAALQALNKTMQTKGLYDTNNTKSQLPVKDLIKTLDGSTGLFGSSGLNGAINDVIESHYGDTKTWGSQDVIDATKEIMNTKSYKDLSNKITNLGLGMSPTLLNNLLYGAMQQIVVGKKSIADAARTNNISGVTGGNTQDYKKITPTQILGVNNTTGNIIESLLNIGLNGLSGSVL